MFNERAFQSWGDILVGACIVSGLFLSLMLMVEEVVGDGARLSRAVLTVTAAAFLGYLGTAWIIRLDQPAEPEGGEKQDAPGEGWR
jgi:hypothetical protein